MPNPTGNFMDKCAFLYSEARVAEHIGIPRKEMSAARVRHLEKEVHWKNRGGQIALSLQGLSHILVSLDLGTSALTGNWHEECLLDPSEKKNGVPPLLICDKDQTPTPIKMIVARLYPNPYMIQAQEKGRSQCYQVRVKSNLRLLVGMELDAIPDPGNAGFWMQVGQPPRLWRGDLR